MDDRLDSEYKRDHDYSNYECLKNLQAALFEHHHPYRRMDL